MVHVYCRITTKRDLNVIIARWIAAPRNAAGLPLKRAGFVVAEIGPEHPVGRQAVGQHTRGGVAGRMLMIVSRREDHELRIDGLDEAGRAAVVRPVMGCDKDVRLEQHLAGAVASTITCSASLQ